VVLIDDLMATGSTMMASMRLPQLLEAQVIDDATIVNSTARAVHSGCLPQAWCYSRG